MCAKWMLFLILQRSKSLLLFNMQGRHMPSIQSSPLHHNVLYRSLQEDNSIHYATEPDGLDETEEKTGLLHNSLPAQPGISRQQLINR